MNNGEYVSVSFQTNVEMQINDPQSRSASPGSETSVHVTLSSADRNIAE